MLNRTNRTLSAHLNRLNLGTRSLANFAGVNTGEQTLRIRHAHRVVLRDGMAGDQPWSLSGPSGEIAGIPTSPDGSPRLNVSGVVPPRVELVEVTTHCGWFCHCGEPQNPSPKSRRTERARGNCKSQTGLRLSQEYGLAGVTLSRASLGFPAA